MTRELRPALMILGLLTFITGILYPASITLVGKLAFAEKASGSLIVRDGQAVGSKLLGQSFSSPRYFLGRPSATASQPYNGAASSGSNLGPTNPALAKAARERIVALRAIDPGNTVPVPIDLVTASGSGLDPHISPAAAEYQVARVARTRGIEERRVRALVWDMTEGRTWGLLGEPRVNMLELNLALDAMK